jgi:hypothetical protein
VREVPAGGGEVPRQQLLLAAEPQARREATGIAEGRPPHDGGAGEEADERVTGDALGTGERRDPHVEVDRVVDAARLDDDVGGHDGDARVGVEHVGGAGERPGSHHVSSSPERDRRAC